MSSSHSTGGRRGREGLTDANLLLLLDTVATRTTIKVDINLLTLTESC